MGYLYNHLATVVCGIFAAVLSVLWVIMVPMFPALEFVFIMAVPIMWFLVAMCWLAQKSADYAHSYSHTEKKSLNSPRLVMEPAGSASDDQIKEAKAELNDDLSRLHDAVKLKDTEIDRLKQEIADLRTMVQIESLKSELANLKVLASKRR